MLGLLRAGLSDQQIAERLDLTLAGAKYHVSEILTKLGVESRADAAAWETVEPSRPWWQRIVALSLAAKLAGGTVIVAAAIGVGVLAWGVASAGSDEGGSIVPPGSSPTATDAPTQATVFDDLNLPPPQTPPTLTHEQALVLASAMSTEGKVAAVDLQTTTVDGAQGLFSGELAGTHDQTAWFARVRLFGNQFVGTRHGNETGEKPIVACRERLGYYLDPGSAPDESTPQAAGQSAGPALPDDQCAGEFTRDLAIMLAANALFDELQGETPEHFTTSR